MNARNHCPCTLHPQVEGLHGLFNELGKIVGEQHEEVETIASSAVRAADATTAAVHELERYQQKQKDECVVQ